MEHLVKKFYGETKLCKIQIHIYETVKILFPDPFEVCFGISPCPWN